MGQIGPIERALKRQAMNVVVQLPEDPVEALRILDYARDLIAEWVEATAEPDGCVTAAECSNLIRLSLRSGGLP
jgi:hypothetical protein